MWERGKQEWTGPSIDLLFQNLLGSKSIHQHLELCFLIVVHAFHILTPRLIYLLHLLISFLLTLGILTEEEVTWESRVQGLEADILSSGRTWLPLFPKSMQGLSWRAEGVPSIAKIHRASLLEIVPSDLPFAF